MGRKWKSVKDMVKDLSDSEFYNEYISRIYAIGYLWFSAQKQYLNLDTKEGVDRYVEAYQYSRFYIDEYEGQEKLREEYFEKNKYKWFYDWYKKLFTKDLKQNNLITWYIDYISHTVSNNESITVEYHPELFEEEKDYFFISRFLTRR
jgi:hypothetical protein